MARESEFEERLIKRLMRQYPGAIILKNDANLIQGFPDRLILWEDRWGAFEVKVSKSAPHRPNQDYYIRLLNTMSFASFVYPGNMETFLDELQQTFRPDRSTRVPFRI